MRTNEEIKEEKSKIISFYGLNVNHNINFSDKVDFICDYCHKKRNVTFKKFKIDFNNGIKDKKCYYCKSNRRDNTEIKKLKTFLLQHNAYKIDDTKSIIYFECQCGNKDKINLKRVELGYIPKCKSCNKIEGIEKASLSKKERHKNINENILFENKNIFMSKNKFYCKTCSNLINIKNKKIICEVCSLREKINKNNFNYGIHEFNQAIKNFAKLDRVKFNLPYEDSIKNFIWFHEQDTHIPNENLNFSLRLKKMLGFPYICKNTRCQKVTGSDLSSEYCSKQCHIDYAKKRETTKNVKNIIESYDCKLLTKGIFDSHTKITIVCKCKNKFTRTAHTLNRYKGNGTVLCCKTCSKHLNLSQEARYKNKPTILYYITFGNFYKIGVCLLKHKYNPEIDIQHRFSGKEYMEYKIEIVNFEIFQNGLNAYHKEQEILLENNDKLLINNNIDLGISGKTEIFKENIKWQK